MIEKQFKKVVLILLLLGAPVFASGIIHEDDTYSLVAFEGGFSSLDSEKNTLGSAAVITKYTLPEVGFKLGAETENYRIFLNLHYYSNRDFDYMTTYGIDLQYKFNFASFVNFYVGAGVGQSNMRFLPAGESTSRTLSNPYVSGDLGVNLHVMDTIDLELGGRVMSLGATNTIANTTYKFDTLVTAYGSIIFKFKMD